MQEGRGKCRRRTPLFFAIKVSLRGVGGRANPYIIVYTGRLHSKGVRFSVFRYMKG